MTIGNVVYPPRFLQILPFTLKQECPYPSNWGDPRNFSNDKFDPGGKTDEGIIQIEYDRWRVAHSLPRRDVRQMTQDEGDDIYYTCYYLPYCPDLPNGFVLDFFDANVNQGVSESIKIMQVALGVHNDGKWGPKTDAAVKAASDVPKLIRAFAARRHVVYTETRNYEHFGVDWDRRNTEIETDSLKMVV